MSSSREVSFENREKYLELGLNIAFYRKRCGLTQEALAERVGISRSHLSAIEAPNLLRYHPDSVPALFPPHSPRAEHRGAGMRGERRG